MTEEETERYEALRAIVERLAAFDDWDLAGEDGRCDLCGGPVGLYAKHGPDCILIAARKWVSQEVAG